MTKPLTTCPDCTRVVSVKAVVCPSCGRPLRVDLVLKAGLVLVMLGVCVAWVVEMVRQMLR
jgi:predicted amidophosphoribosyltransferase